MPATELVVKSLGIVGGKEVLQPTGATGIVYPTVNDWVSGKIKLNIPVKNTTTCVVVQGVKQWAAYEEPFGTNVIQTVFEIT